MKWRGPGAALVLAASAILALVLAPYAWRMMDSGIAPGASVDPAFEFHTRTHSASYGGIDRWAYYGMRVERVAELLGKEGYACRLPQAPADAGKLDGIHEMVCDKQLRWPLARTLSIKADIEYGTRGRLVAASASSIPAGDAAWRRSIADLLRMADLIEPASLAIRGFEIDSAELLARLAVDALLPRGWRMFCEGDDQALPECVQSTRERRAKGFAPLPEGAAAVVNAGALHTALDRVRLMPLAPRDPNGREDSNLLVRVTDARMWMDFAGRDLAGHQLLVSIALDSAGGAPAQLVARVDKESRAVQLAGAPLRLNNGALRYLVPARGADNPRASMWLDLPNPDYPRTLNRLADELANADPAFGPPLVKVILDNVVKAARPEETLGLYPALRSIEQRAAILRAAHAERWLPVEQADPLVRQAYPDDAATRAAWALATCQAAGKPPVIDADCWRRLTREDAAVITLLGNQVAELQTLYAALDATHPIRLRLKRLADTLALAHD